MFREMCSLEPGAEVVLVGSEFGVEVWGAEAWQREMLLMQQHSMDKGEIELNADLDIGKKNEE